MSADGRPDPLDPESPPPAARTSWPKLREALAAVGFRPSRRLGQNFLVDTNAARAIARDSGVGAGDVVVEVGVGLGFLTEPLLERGIASLVAVEIDPRLLALAREEIGPDPRVRWIQADALAGKHALAPELEAVLAQAQPVHVVSNLPYSISGPLLALLAERDEPPASMTVLVQAEVAARLLASPGTSDWGPLSVGVQSAYAGRVLRTLPPSLFRPRPKVQSALVRLEPLPGRAGASERARVTRLARSLLQYRRQTLLRVVGRLAGDPSRAAASLLAAGLDGSQRAEVLDLASLGRLAAAADWLEE
jgi:16S rRNA (adenine1518-N6/adenine1519-N6)-dimethyltransferase